MELGSHFDILAADSNAETEASEQKVLIHQQHLHHVQDAQISRM